MKGPGLRLEGKVTLGRGGGGGGARRWWLSNFKVPHGSSCIRALGSSWPFSTSSTSTNMAPRTPAATYIEVIWFSTALHLHTIVRRFALQRSNSHHPSKDLLNARIIFPSASVRTLLQMLLHHIICPAMYRLSHVAMLVLHYTSGECTLGVPRAPMHHR